MSPSVDAPSLEWAMTKLATAFPASFPTEEKAAAVSLLWRELLDQHPWITREVFATAVYQIAWHHKDDFLPGPAAALDFFREAQRKAGAAHAAAELERLEERQAAPEAQPALPASSTGRWDDRSGPEQADFLLRHLAIGKLKGRSRLTRAECSEAEIGAMEEELRRSGFMRRALTRIREGRPVSPDEFIGALYGPTRRSQLGRGVTTPAASPPGGVGVGEGGW